VFVARLAEERDDPEATVFALKVPEYNASVANVLSESDFLAMFREEAGALLALPSDEPHLAAFVTFDAGVKPRPMLVMEHVEGPSLERMLQRRQADVQQSFDILLGVAKGLSAMHRLGLAHLDLKPANVILRDFWAAGDLLPVLVDFGLAGRRLRPGCGTPSYAAPEIWNQEPSSEDPRPADVYALGCLAYELLTGAMLFDGESDGDFQGLHAVHDGSPALIQAMHRDLALRPLAEFLSRCLCHKPGLRLSIHDVVRQVALLKQEYAARAWPIVPAQAAIRAGRAR
jgi:serine/threonine protein kinase